MLVVELANGETLYVKNMTKERFDRSNDLFVTITTVETNENNEEVENEMLLNTSCVVRTGYIN